MDYLGFWNGHKIPSLEKLNHKNTILSDA